MANRSSVNDTHPQHLDDLIEAPVGTVLLASGRNGQEIVLRTRRHGRPIWVSSSKPGRTLIDADQLIEQLLDVTHDYRAELAPADITDGEPVALLNYNDLAVTDEEADVLDARRRAAIASVVSAAGEASLTVVRRRGTPVEAFHRVADGWLSTTNACHRYLTAEMRELLRAATVTILSTPDLRPPTP